MFCSLNISNKCKKFLHSSFFVCTYFVEWQSPLLMDPHPIDDPPLDKYSPNSRLLLGSHFASCLHWKTASNPTCSAFQIIKILYSYTSVSEVRLQFPNVSQLNWYFDTFSHPCVWHKWLLSISIMSHIRMVPNEIPNLSNTRQSNLTRH